MLSALQRTNTYQALRDSRSGAPSKILYVQYLRAAAALSVVIGHVFHELFKFSADLPAAITWVIDRNLAYGAGVDLFFVISGFIMMHSSEKFFGSAGASKNFMVRRLIRIVPAYWFFTFLLLIPALLLPQTLDRVAFDPGLFISSLFFIPHASDSFGFKPYLPVGWTLYYEMLFYCIFAAALFLGRRAGLAAIALALTALFVVGQFLPPEWTITTYLTKTIIFEFLFGMAAYLAIKHNRRWAFIAVVGACGIAYEIWIGDRLAHGFGAAVLMVLCQMLFSSQRIKLGLLAATGLVLGEASYILYLSHPFVIEVCSQVSRAVFGGTILAIPIYIVGSIFACCGFAILFHYEVDARAQIWLRRKFT